MNKIVVTIDASHVGFNGLLVLLLTTLTSWFYRGLFVAFRVIAFLFVQIKSCQPETGRIIQEHGHIT